MTPIQVGSEEYGAALRDAGMSMASRRKEWQIRMGQLALLQAIRLNPERIASTDDATSDVGEKYPDGGRWRGSIPRQLSLDGLIEKAGVIKSVRAHRHRGYVTLWRGRDDDAMDTRIAELRRWLDMNPPPSVQSSEANPESLFDCNQNRAPDVPTPSAHN